jgi:hypothetical protein
VQMSPRVEAKNPVNESPLIECCYEKTDFIKKRPLFFHHLKIIIVTFFRTLFHPQFPAE